MSSRRQPSASRVETELRPEIRIIYRRRTAQKCALSRRINYAGVSRRAGRDYFSLRGNGKDNIEEIWPLFQRGEYLARHDAAPGRSVRYRGPRIERTKPNEESESYARDAKRERPSKNPLERASTSFPGNLENDRGRDLSRIPQREFPLREIPTNDSRHSLGSGNA